MLTWGPWPAAPSCLSSWWPPCLWCLHLCLPRHPAVSPTLQQPPLQRASCHSLLCSQPWQRKAVLELPVVYLNRCREKINTHDMNKAAWLNSLYLNVFYLLATDGASYQMPAGLHDATQLAFPAGLCSVGKRVAGGGQFHLPWQEVKIWRWMLGSLEVKLIFCLWSANQLQIRDLSVQFLADKVNLKWTAKKRGGWQSLALSSTFALSADELLLRFDILDLSWAAYAECVKVFSVSVWTGRDCFWWLHILFSLHQIGCVPSLVWMLPPLDFQADRPQEVAVAFRLLRQIRPAAFSGSHLVVLFQLEFVRNIRNWQPQYKLISWMLTWGPWPAAPSCLSSWWPPCLWCLHLCLPRHPAVSPTLQQPPLQRASCHSLLCSQPWQRKAVLELPVVYLNRCREKINTHDMNKAAWLNSLYLNVFYLLATDGASYQMPAGLHDATQLAFPAGLCSVGKRVAGGGQFHLPWQEVKIWRWMLGSLEVKLIFCLWSANQLQIRDLSVQFLADKVNLKWTAKKRGAWHSDLRGTNVWYLRFVAHFVLSAPNWMCAFTCLDAAAIGLSSW